MWWAALGISFVAALFCGSRRLGSLSTRVSRSSTRVITSTFLGTTTAIRLPIAKKNSIGKRDPPLASLENGQELLDLT